MHPDPETLITPKGTEISWVGPPLEKGPLPAFIYFALTGHESLTLDPYNQPITFLPDIRCFSLTFPMHGPDYDPRDAVSLWAAELAKGNDILSPFINRCLDAVDTIRPHATAIASGGLSRGGIAALHLAARHPLVNTVVGFAPITDLTYLAGYDPADPLVQMVSPTSLYDKLINKKIRFYIGNRDHRVGTREAFTFVETLVERSYKKGLRSPPVELILSPSIGFKGHGTPKEIFKNGAEWVRSSLEI